MLIKSLGIALLLSLLANAGLYAYLSVVQGQKKAIQGELTLCQGVVKQTSESLEKEQKKLQALHKKRKAEGYTHHVCAWIHGTGDDYQIDFWTKGLMSDEDIKKYLMKKGSVSLDDFVVQKL